MLSPLISLLLPPLLLVPAMGLLSCIESRSPIEIEFRRKAFHISIGLASLSFPLFLTKPWMVIAALSLVFFWMYLVRHMPTMRRRFGPVLHATDRHSNGEMYFAFAIGALLLASNGDSVLYVIPLLILSIADALAAIVGRIMPLMPLSGLAKGKTASGSAAFCITALLVTLPALMALTDFSFGLALVVALTIAVATCIAEAISSRGFDNLAVPAVALFILKLLAIGAV
jgi:phytol kinase